MEEHHLIVSIADIEGRIFLIRGHKVMLSMDLSELYEVEPRILIQAVKRNAERFPSDFMFQLTLRELTNLKSQFVISSWGGRRTLPYAFTEQGVAMLSGVLNSPRAIQVNIEIMRAFVRIRQMLSTDKDLARKLDALEKKYDQQSAIQNRLRRHPPTDDTLRQTAAKDRLWREGRADQQCVKCKQ